VAPIKISLAGLTRCTGCQTHIKVADVLEATTCPFCETSLVRPKGRHPGLVARSRGALIAASLLASPALAGCLSGDTTDHAADGTADAGVDITQDANPADLVSGQPVYGIAMDVVEADHTASDAAQDVEIVEDLTQIEPYGLPPEGDASM